MVYHALIFKINSCN